MSTENLLNSPYFIRLITNIQKNPFMSFIEDYRKILKRRIKEYHWTDIQTEIASFFGKIQSVTIPDSAKFCLKKFKLSQKEILDKFDLDEKKLRDIINIDQIFMMLDYIKEINFCFPNNWNTLNYRHHEHGYKLKTLIEAIEDEVEGVIQFKADKFQSIIDKQEDFLSSNKFIDLNFAEFGLSYYQPYIRLINRIAFHPDFYMILPHLLRSLFENLLRDIFSQSLDYSDADLYYSSRNKRAYDFSRLISLLELLKDNEFGPFISGKITIDTIRELENIRKIGNYSIHDIVDKITPEWAKDFNKRIKITLEPLLISYKNLRGKIPSIDPKRKFKIKDDLGLIPRKTKIEDKKKNSRKKVINSNSRQSQFFKDLFNRFEEAEKPKNDNNFKDNSNYRYLCYKVKSVDKQTYLDTNDFKHLIIQASEELKRFLVENGVLSFNEATALISGYYLRIPYTKIKIEQGKISVHRSHKDLVKGPLSLDETIQYFLKQLENLISKT